MEMVYAKMYELTTGDAKCIVLAPGGSSMFKINEAVNQAMPGGKLRFGGLLTDAEAETLIEMGILPVVDFSDPSCWDALKPMEFIEQYEYMLA